MRVRSASDVVYSSIAWLPVLAVIVAVAWVMAMGVFGLESVSFGTEYFVKNSETANVLPTPRSAEDDLMAALDSGDEAQMQAALDRYDARAAAATAG